MLIEKLRTPAASVPTDHAFRRILVPVDGSAQAEQSLAHAVAIARAAEADLQLVWARPVGSRTRQADAGRSARMGHLEALTEEVSDRLGAPATRAVLSGRPADAILERATATGVDLIVMACRGHNGLWRLGIGGTTDLVVQAARVPVLVVRAASEEEPSLDVPVRLEEIVVALDGSDAAERALGPAIALAGVTGAGLTLLRVVEPSRQREPKPLFQSILPQDIMTPAMREAHDYLDRVAASLRARGLAVNTALREAESAAAGILRFAREADADVVALGTRGAGHAPRLMRGATVSRLLHDADVPLLISNS